MSSVLLCKRRGGEKIEILSLSQRVSNCFDTGTVKTISCITSDVVTCSGKVHKR